MGQAQLSTIEHVERNVLDYHSVHWHWHERTWEDINHAHPRSDLFRAGIDTMMLVFKYVGDPYPILI